MKKIISWMLGVVIGTGVGAGLVALLSPITGDEAIRRLKRGYQEALDEAHRAREQHKADLEAELAEMQKGRKESTR
jgi:hypothetical protein